jgi:hypothetical protein
MDEKQLERLEQLRKTEITQSQKWMDYWQAFSDFSTWEFWFGVSLFVIPLIVLILFIDRKKILQIGFYGYGVHVFFTHIDNYGVNNGIWEYPFKIFPFIPTGIALDTSFVPVCFMLLYQYIINKDKNYYLWMLGLCIVFSYIIKPLMVGVGLFYFGGGKENFFILLIGYVTIALMAKWLTDLFLFLQKSNKWSFNRLKS